MSLILPRLLDSEKYMLSELAYFHLPKELAGRDFGEHPLGLAEYVEAIPRCRLSYYMKPEADGGHSRYFADRIKRFRGIIERSQNLEGVSLTGYINDNYDAYGNTVGRDRSGLVALAFSDSEDNLIVVYSGCEESCPSSILLDWADCVRAAVGVITRQQRAALRFFDGQVCEKTRGKGVIGHSKGGNLATHIYVNHMGEGIRAYCINAQPYCWPKLSGKQKAALKGEAYELIMHAGDIVSYAGYQSCISRIVPVNPYLGRARVIDFHCYVSQLFDEQGNLAGDRILRKTGSRLKSRLFNDYAQERAPSPEETLRRFEELLDSIPSLARLIHLALEEILLIGNMSSVVLLLRGRSARGDYLYPYIAKGKGARNLHSVNLSLDQGRMASAIEQGLPIYYPTLREESAHLLLLGNILEIKVRSAGIIPIAREGEPYAGVLEILCDDEKVDTNDLTTAFDMAALLSKRVSSLALTALFEPPETPLCDIRLECGDSLLLNRYEYREIGKSERNWLGILVFGALKEGDEMQFDGWRFDASDRSTLKNLRRRGVAYISAKEWRAGGRRARALLPECDGIFYTPESAAEIAGLAPEKLDARLSELDQYERLCLRLAIALIKRSPLIIFDERDCPEESARLFRANLHLVCYDKLATVLVVRS